MTDNIYWCVQDPKGRWMIGTLDGTRDASVDRFVCRSESRLIRDWYDALTQGYRVAKVKIVEVE